MALRVGEALEYASHAIGSPGDPIIGTSLLNRAGEWLASCHSWKWLEGASATLNTVNGQNYINLPSGFAALLAYEATSSLVNSLRPTNFQTLQEMRSHSISVDSGIYFFAITHAAAGGTGGAPTPRIELFPTPNASSSGFFTIWYRSGWTTVSNDNDLISVPAWVESLFLEVVAEFALGVRERDNMPLDMRLARIKAGDLYRAAAIRDGNVQGNYGPSTGGAILNEPIDQNWLRSTVAAPS